MTGATGVQAEAELDRLTKLVGAPVIGAERPAWGFANRTTIATLLDGRRWVVQELQDPIAGRAVVARARLLADRLTQAGVTVPGVVITEAGAIRPLLVTAFVGGQLGPSLLGTNREAAALGGLMGATQRRLAALDTTDLRLPTTWAVPERLAAVSRRRLGRVASRLDRRTIGVVERAIEEHAGLPSSGPPVFAHGDFAPANVIVSRGELAALIDFEYARLADPLFDAATFQWLTFHFHPARAEVAWAAFAEAAGIAAGAEDPLVRAALARLRLLRILELVEVAGRRGPAMRDRWLSLLAADAASGLRS
jgi:aminoglycoside phosphotransferase (APT) family kinase protein